MSVSWQCKLNMLACALLVANTGDMLVRSHPLAAVAAVARRRSSLRPIGLELFMLSPGVEPHLQQQLGQLSGPFWDAPSAFFTFRWVLWGRFGHSLPKRLAYIHTRHLQWLDKLYDTGLDACVDGKRPPVSQTQYGQCVAQKVAGVLQCFWLWGWQHP